jgi:hypothetical protein
MINEAIEHQKHGGVSVPKVTFMPAGQSFSLAEHHTRFSDQNGIHLRHDCTEAICGTDR